MKNYRVDGFLHNNEDGKVSESVKIEFDTIGEALKYACHLDMKDYKVFILHHRFEESYLELDSLDDILAKIDMR